MTLDTFVKLSSILTGFATAVLKPQNDTQKLSELYFGVLQKEVDPSVLDQLNTTFLNISAPDQATVKAQIVDNTQLGPISKSITKMWYLGIWYTPSDPATGYVISSIAYKNGMVWSTMYAHPMGYSEENFGYWETPSKT